MVAAGGDPDGSEGGGGGKAGSRGKKERRVRTRMLNRIVYEFSILAGEGEERRVTS